MTVPIQSEPPSTPSDPMAPQPSHQGKRGPLRWGIVFLAVAMTILIVGVAVVFLNGSDDSSQTIVGRSTAVPATSAPTSTFTRLMAAHQACGNVGELADAGKTLILDMRGEDPDSGELAFFSVRCVLDAISTPAYVVEIMQQTRALDGRQSESWGSFRASWTYHPDDGLDVLITEDGGD